MLYEDNLDALRELAGSSRGVLNSRLTLRRKDVADSGRLCCSFVSFVQSGEAKRHSPKKEFFQASILSHSSGSLGITLHSYKRIHISLLKPGDFLRKPANPHDEIRSTAAMPPKKKSPLDKIRERSRIKHAANASIMAGSAFQRLTESNDAARPAATHTSDAESSFNKISVRSAASPTKVTKTASTPAKKPPVRKKEAPKEVECWQPAGGEVGVENKTTATPVLGIARIPLWREEDFKAELHGLLDAYDDTNDVEDVFRYAFEHGGEKNVDVYVRFTNKTAAAIMRQSIAGKQVMGRRLRVFYGAE